MVQLAPHHLFQISANPNKRNTQEKPPVTCMAARSPPTFPFTQSNASPLSASFKERHQHWTTKSGNQNAGTSLTIILEWVQISNFQGGSTHKNRNQDWINPGCCSGHGHISTQDSLPKTDKEFRGHNPNSSSHSSNSLLCRVLFQAPRALSSTPGRLSHPGEGMGVVCRNCCFSSRPCPQRMRGWEERPVSPKNTCSSTRGSNPNYWNVSKKESTWKHSCFDHFQLPNLWTEGFTQPQPP